MKKYYKIKRDDAVANVECASAPESEHELLTIIC
jgi:hypothetical protein